MTKKRKLWIGGIFLFIVGIIVCSKSVSNIIGFKNELYKTPANSAFNDINFYKCVIDNYNYSNGTNLGYDVNLTDEQLSSIYNLYCDSDESDNKIVDITGIHKMSSLKNLSLTHNNLVDVDLHNNTLLEVAYLGLNEDLTNVNLDGLTYLKSLYIDENYKGLGYSGEDINVHHSHYLDNLNQLNLNTNTSLEYVSIYGTNISELNLSNNAALEELNLEYNNLISVDLSQNTSLKKLNLSRNNLTSIDLSHNALLINLDLSGNELTNINLSNNVGLEILDLGFNRFTSVDLNRNTALTELYLNNNNLTGINLSGAEALTKLILLNNQLTSIDLSRNAMLINLDLSGNKLTDINLSSNDRLEKLDLASNQLISIVLGHNTSLTKLDLESNELASVNLSFNTLLEELNLSRNNLTNINLDNNSSLKILNLCYNQLTSVNLKNNTLIRELNLEFNQLASIDLSHNTILRELDLESNQLTNVDLSKNVNLEKIDLNRNLLENIDFSHNTNLSNFSLPNIGVVNRIIYKNDFYDFTDYSSFSNLLKFSSNKNYNYAFECISSSINGECSSSDSLHHFWTSLSKENVYVKYNIYENQNSILDSFYVKYEYRKIEASSDKYTINPDNSYIYEENGIDSYVYTKSDVDAETILANISLPDIDGLDGIIEDDKYIIKYNGEIVRSFDLVNYSSSKYDMSKDYLASGNIMAIYVDYSIGEINCTNCNLDFGDDTISIKHNNNSLKDYRFVGYMSDDYNLNKSYVKVEDENIESFLGKIDCTNCTAYVFDGTNYLTTGNFDDDYTLRIMYDNDLVKEFQLKYSVSGVSLNKNDLKLNLDTKKTYQLVANVLPGGAENKNVTWESSNTNVAMVDEDGLVTAKSYGDATITVKTVDGEFTDTCNVVVSDLVTYTVTFKDGNNTYISEFEEGEDIILKTDLVKEGYKLIGWKYDNQDYSLEDRLVMPGNDIELSALWELIVPEINYESSGNIITGIELGVDISNLDLGIDSIYQVKISKYDGTVKTAGLLGTGDKIEIYLDDKLVSSYFISIKGDINGDGGISISDASMIYKRLRESVTFTNIQTIASDLNNDSSISISDISMIYKYIKNHS